MKQAMVLLSTLATQESGQDLLAYASILSLTGLGAMVALKSLMNSVGTDSNNAGNVLTPSV